MKKVLVVMCLNFFLTTVCDAQQPVLETRKIKRDEVPALVQNSLKDNFSLSPKDGTWNVHYTLYGFGGQTPTPTVISYTFRQKTDGEKVEISFSPKGNVEHLHGIEKSPKHVGASG